MDLTRLEIDPEALSLAVSGTSPNSFGLLIVGEAVDNLVSKTTQRHA